MTDGTYWKTNAYLATADLSTDRADYADTGISVLVQQYKSVTYLERQLERKLAGWERAYPVNWQNVRDVLYNPDWKYRPITDEAWERAKQEGSGPAYDPLPDTEAEQERELARLRRIDETIWAELESRRTANR